MASPEWSWWHQLGGQRLPESQHNHYGHWRWATGTCTFLLTIKFLPLWPYPSFSSMPTHFALLLHSIGVRCPCSFGDQAVVVILHFNCGVQGIWMARQLLRLDPQREQSTLPLQNGRAKDRIWNRPLEQCWTGPWKLSLFLGCRLKEES